MHFDYHYARSIAPIIAHAALTTIWVTIVSSLLATALGFGLELLRRINRPVELAMTVVIDFFRITPILALLYFLYFVLPFYGIDLPAIVVGILTLSLHYSGYLAEVFKGAIASISAGQAEGAQALGMRRSQVVLFVLLPQMLRNAMPPIANYVLSILKSTPYLAVIAVPEMLGAAMDQAADSFTYVEPMTVVGIMFFLFCLGSARALDAVHRHLRRHD